MSRASIPISRGQISLTAYQPNKLTYKAVAQAEQLAVFRNLGMAPTRLACNPWMEKVDHIRQLSIENNERVPASNHTIEFTFKPEKYYRGERISHSKFRG